ncbi:hypothetical protein J3F83DRAFT_726052 [Trichoderma novae-zelandiae]
MALLGISLIVASFVFVVLRQPQWLRLPWQSFAGGVGAITDGKEDQTSSDQERRNRAQQNKRDASHGVAPRIAVQPSNDDTELDSRGSSSSASSAERTSSTMRQRKPDDGAPSTLPTIQPPTIIPPTIVSPAIQEPESPTTPRAQGANPAQPVPSFSLAESASLTMPPPPLPSSRPNGRIPALSQFPAPNSAQRARGPTPNRGPPAASSSSSPSGLAPPPTLSSKPAKPSRQVVLTPGHSPLDWARISGPNSDLRGVAPSTPYLRVTPSMLKVQTGRKGKDAWMALNGKVYNVTPYAKFHPGGVPEMMRGAGRDGTKLFGEIHPWVNYETMLAACLVGLLVDEPEGKESEMDRMD